MKKFKILASTIVIVSSLLILSACGGTDQPQETDETILATLNYEENTNNEENANIDEPNINIPDGDNFLYSYGLDENGFFAGITALNYVEMFNHAGLPIPRDVHYIPNEIIQGDINSILGFFSESTQLFDRPVVHGDTINIDFVGSVDGVEFAGGNTLGMGMEVTIGVTQFIDDFLYQLIGAMPGDVVNVEVTFPDSYPQEPSLEGAEALFITTVNFIIETTTPELTDAFVEENLAPFFGWLTVEDMKEGIKNEIQGEFLRDFVKDFVTNQVVVHSIPEAIIRYQENHMINGSKMSAAELGIGFNEFILMHFGANDIEELIALQHDAIVEQATLDIIIQAIAEDAGIRVSRDDIANFFMTALGIDDYSEFEEIYGLPFLKRVVLSEIVLDYLLENAVFE